MVRSIVCICFFIITSYSAIIGQRFESLNDIHPIARANCIYQDDYGFIWFGTRDGLVKYDGFSTTNYRKSINDPYSLPGPEVLSIVQFSDSILLIGMSVHGLIKFNRNTGKFYPFPPHNGLMNMNVYSLLKDKKNNIWAGTNRGLFKYSEGKIQHFSKEDFGTRGLVSHQIRNLYEDSNGSIWIGSTEGIYKFSLEAELNENPLNNYSFPKKRILDIKEDRNGQLWISVSDDEYSLYVFEMEDNKFIPIQWSKNGGEYKFIFDQDNNMWISSHREGVIKLAKDYQVLFSPQNYRLHGLRSYFTQSIILDKYQNIWLHADDIYKISGNNKNFKWLETDGFLVSGLFADEDYIWYCSEEPMRWSRSSGKTETLFPNKKVESLQSEVSKSDPIRMYHFEEMGDSLIFTSINDLYIWNRKNDETTKFPTYMEGAFRDFIVSRDKKIWIAANMDKVLVFDLETNKFESFEDLMNLETVCTVTTSDNGVQWWGTHENGLFRYKPQTSELKHFVPDPNQATLSLSSYNVTDVLSHSDGTIWVGTKVGLDRIDPITEQISHYPLGSKLDQIFVASLIEDDNGAIWVGTQNGLVYLDPKMDILKHYTREDGILNTIYTPRASFKDRAGNLYFGGKAGIDYFHPDEISENTIPPDLYIKSLKINGENYSRSVGESINKITLTHKDKYLEIELLGLHMSSSNGNTYSYQLQPQIDDWINIGNNRKINLGKLKAGEFQFIAKCANPDGIWSSPTVLLTIDVKPPFWFTKWFFICAFVVFVGSLYVIYAKRIQSLRKKESIKIEINKQMAEIEMKALRAQMNPHFLFNCLNSIKLLINNNENDKARNYITKFSELIRNILDNSSKKVVRLEEEMKSVEIYLQLEQMRFKNFTYEIKIDKDIPIDFIDIPPLLIQPFVENAIWHGLMNKQDGEKKLNINISKFDDTIFIIIEDNGIGRKQAQLLTSKNNKKATSLGTQLSQNRIKVYNDLYDKKMSIEILDLEDPIRTQVNIILPEQE